MSVKNLSAEDIIYVIRCHETGLSIAEVCRIAGITELTYFEWKRQYLGLTEDERAHLNTLKRQSSRTRNFLEKLKRSLVPKRNSSPDAPISQSQKYRSEPTRYHG